MLHGLSLILLKICLSYRGFPPSAITGVSVALSFDHFIQLHGNIEQ